MSAAGVVIIGRNEGERLARCLASLPQGVPAVYVDSGSSDGSAKHAEIAGFPVVALDAARPFTAARARNAGFAWLDANRPGLEFVQFVDGDCELMPGWLEAGEVFLGANPRAAAVFGGLRERRPEVSVYNRLCELEWNEMPVGIVPACGGIAMMRTEAVRAAGGFREDLIAGEEPELCVRLRGRGWTVHRIAADMATHDAAMTRFSQWWTRAVRAGHAYAEGVRLHGRRGDANGARAIASALAWGLILPLGAIALGAFTHAWGLALLLLCPLQWLRLTLQQRRRGRPADLAWRQAGLLLVGKFAHIVGFTRFLLRPMIGRPVAIIEYKPSSPVPAEART